MFEMVTIVSYNETIKKANIGTMKTFICILVQLCVLKLELGKVGYNRAILCDFDNNVCEAEVEWNTGAIYHHYLTPAGL